MDLRGVFAALMCAVTACAAPAPEPTASVAQPLTVVPVEGGVFNGTTSGNSTYGGSCGQGTSVSPEAVFQWVAPRSGSATFKTCGGQTNFDTVLYVRRNTITGQEASCNDDATSCSISTGQSWASKVTITVTAGTTYFAFVDGYGSMGKYTFTLTPPPGGPADAASDTGSDSADAVAEGGSDGDSSDQDSNESAAQDAGGDGGSDGDGAADEPESGGPDDGGSDSQDALSDVGGGSDSGSDAAPGGPYPLRTQAGARYLIDQQGNPFFIHGDTAWSMMAQLTTEEATTWLEDRKNRGVNTAIVNLIEFYYASNAPRDRYNNGPFTTPNDFATPNVAYFNRADQVIQAASSRGIQLFLFPAYLGWVCSYQVGWYEVMAANGVTKMFNYGAWLGARYRDTDNIVWVLGGDCDAPNKELVRQLALGIRSQDTRHIMTTHGEVTDTLDFWSTSADPWIDFDSVYNYPYAGNEMRTRVLSEYNRSNWLPVFKIESHYEDENNATPFDLRQHSYETILNGGMGQFYGSSAWCFGGGGCYGDWQAMLNSPGAQDQQRLKSFFATRPWWKLVPQSFLSAGGSGASVERANDGTWGAAYFPTQRSITVNLSSFAQSVTGRWYNPATGAYTVIAGSPFAPSGVVTTSPPATGDWVVVFE